jgi:SET domain-containing protein
MKFIKNKLDDPTQSWITPKAKKGMPSNISGKGLLAALPIKKDELLIVKAGRIIDKKTFLANKDQISGAEAQITDELYIAPLTPAEIKASMAYCNHSCNPNAGFGGNVLVRAMRDIQPGEEITIDYAMELTDTNYSLDCKCGSKICRKVITGNDWKSLELQKKYAGYFQWYIDQKIMNPNT